MKSAATLSVVCLFLVASCGPSSEPAPEAALPPVTTGSDEPGAPMEPVPDPRPMTFEAMSRTAEAFTGAITLTAEPRSGPNAPPAMKIAAANGLVLRTELMPGAAEQATIIDWKALFGDGVVVGADAPPGAPTIDMHAVVSEEVPAASINGGLCGPDEPAAFIAMATGLELGGHKYMSIAAFRGHVWPPENPDVLCGTFNYVPPASAL
ncbi:MAG: hypothetical protein R3C46_02520 [Hyphomonadaceae bacterium]